MWYSVSFSVSNHCGYTREGKCPNIVLFINHTWKHNALLCLYKYFEGMICSSLLPPATLGRGSSTTPPASPLVAKPSALLPLRHLGPEIFTECVSSEGRMHLFNYESRIKLYSTYLMSAEHCLRKASSSSPSRALTAVSAPFTSSLPPSIFPATATAAPSVLKRSLAVSSPFW